MTTPRQLYANNTSTLLKSSITSSALVLEVVDGSAFPTPEAGQFFKVTLDTGVNFEIVEVWSRSGNLFSGLVRGAEGTTASVFPAGTKAEMRVTAESMSRFDDLQQQVDALQESTFTDVGSILFNATPDTLTPRRLAWNPEDLTLDLDTGTTGVVLQLGQEEVIRVKNASGATLAKGSPVYLTGADLASGRVTAALAVADSTIAPYKLLGLAAESIANGAEGFVQASGVLQPVDATGAVWSETWSVGDVLYVSGSVAGALTKTAPPNTSQKLAVGVVVDNTTSGSVRLLQGYSSAVRFNNSGSGSASGSVFDGSSPLTVSYNTIGAPRADGLGASGTWNISVLGNAATATSAASAATASTISDGAVSSSSKIAAGVVTPAKLSTGAPTWGVSGNVDVAGTLSVPVGPLYANGIMTYGTRSISGAQSINNTFSGSQIMLSGGNYIITLPAASLSSGFTATFSLSYGQEVTLATIAGDRIYGDVGAGGTSCVMKQSLANRYTLIGIDGASWGLYAEYSCDASGNLLTNSGFGSLAPAYGCRAWVNFNGVALSGTYGRSGTLVTVSMTGHGMSTGQTANLTFSAGTGGTATSGSYTVTVLGSDSFTVTDVVSGTITGSPAAVRNAFINASGNVSSIVDNGIGDYTLNFTRSMPDLGYATVGTVSSTSQVAYVFKEYEGQRSLGGVRVLTSRTSNVSDGAYDAPTCSVAIFR